MRIDWRKEILPIAVLLALCAVLLGFRLGKTGLIDPDEPFYSLTAKEMLERHDPSTPVMFGEPQFEKPILFYWVLYGCFRWLGVNEFAARLGPCLAGLAAVFVTYFWARVLFRRRRDAFLSAAVLVVSLQFVALSRIVLTDIFLCLFVTSALFFFSLGERYEKHRTLCWNAVFAFAALGFLTKGPLGVFIPFAGILPYLNRKKRRISGLPWASGLALFAVIGLPWYALMAWKYGPPFLEQTFFHENLRRFFVAEHPRNDHFIFYPFVIFSGFFPWCAAVSAGLAYAWRRRVQDRYFFLGVSVLLPFLFFSAASSKLISYIFPVFPAVAVLTGSWLSRFVRAVDLGASPRRIFLAANAFVLGVLPLALVTGAFLFTERHGEPAHAPLLAIALTTVPLAWAGAALLYLKRYRAAFAATVAAMLFLSSLSFGWLLPSVEPSISSKKWAESVPHSKHALLISKLFVRGISFYSQHPAVGVFSGRPDGGFYTAHPIPIVSDAEGLSRMSEDGAPLFLLLRGKELKHLNGINGGRYSLSVLEATPSRRWIRLDHV